MNIRTRQMERAMMQRKYKPIVAVLHMDGALPRLVFIDPREWEEYKERYGDDLKILFEEGKS